MRNSLIALAAFAGLAACDRAPKGEEKASAAKPLQVSFEGSVSNDDAARIAHGERISWALGCHGCHGDELQGKRFYELYASNLTREIPKYSDAQLERLIRGGVHPTGLVGKCTHACLSRASRSTSGRPPESARTRPSESAPAP